MDWLIIAIPMAFFLIRFLLNESRIANNKKKMDERRKIQNTYYTKTVAEFPELTDNYYKPNRDPIDQNLRPKILDRTEGHCFYCDSELNPFNWQIDHVWPYRMGGTHELINLVPACRNCNEAKWAQLPTIFLLKKWALGGVFTKHEKNFIEYHRTHSMSYLIATSAYWKSKSDYIKDYLYSEFADLVLNCPAIVSLTGEKRERIIDRTKKLLTDLEAPSLRRKSNGYSYTERPNIELWLKSFDLERNFRGKQSEN